MWWKFSMVVVSVAVGLRVSEAVVGGAACSIPSQGSPGASTVCTSSTNGFCLLDHLTITGINPVNSVNSDGVCVCRSGYSGPNCAVTDPPASTGSTTVISNNSNNNAIAALVLGGLGAYYLSQLGSGQNAWGLGYGSPLSAKEALYLQQAGLVK